MARPSSIFDYSILITFVGASLIGGALLYLPVVSHIQGLTPLDALFTATSAVCVTGLATVPTSGFNLAGQLIILALIQLGGLGIMTLTSSLMLFAYKRLNLRQRIMAAQVTDTISFKEVEAVLKTILGFTLVAETIGAFLLAAGFILEGQPVERALYLGLFHSISAFCNAGFSTFDSSMIGHNWLVKSIVMLLIFFGGIGYYVVYDCLDFLWRRDRVTNHTKVVLWVSLALVIFGAVGLWMVEKGGISPLDALFQSVTARTAGFNSVDLASLHTVSLFLILVLMIIGASPGSTGGGLKTTTVFVALSSIYSALKGHTRVVILGRRVPMGNILRAFALIFIYLAVFCLGTGTILLTERISFIQAAFEVASALGTVGLTLDVTPHLSFAGKVVIIITMLVGRVGPATLALLFLRSETKSHVDYPEERFILG